MLFKVRIKLSGNWFLGEYATTPEEHTATVYNSESEESMEQLSDLTEQGTKHVILKVVTK